MTAATSPAPLDPAPTPSDARDPVVAEMLRGHASLEEIAAGLDLTTRQRLAVRMAALAVHAYRVGVLPLRGARVRRLRAELDALCGQRIRTLGPASAHFTEADRATFERDGVLGPFAVMTPDEAAALAARVQAGFERGFEGGDVLGADFEATLRRHGAWDRQMAGMHQGLRLPALREVLRRPAVADRLAGILGEDVICWRTQFFEKGPGAEGTFWHQASTFRESSDAPKLAPTRPIDAPIAQLTVWMALTDVSVRTAAMRILPGSFADGRLERLYALAMDELPLFLALLPPAWLETCIAVNRHTTGNFVRSQAAFEAALGLLGGSPFAGREVRDLEMRAGQCVIFTSMNVHGAHGNTTADRTRLAFVARCAASHVRVTQPTFVFPTPEGRAVAPLPEVNCFRIRGEGLGVNRLMPD